MMHRLSFLVGLTLVLSWRSGLGGQTVVSDSVTASQRAERPKMCYLDFATLKYEGGRLTAANSESSPTGFTVVRIEHRNQQRTRLAVSGAFLPGTPNATDLRVAAKDHEGKLHLPTVQSVASATGKKRKVVTLLCEFALPEKDVHQLVIQRKGLVTTANLGMVTARVIIKDEDEEEAREALGSYILP